MIPVNGSPHDLEARDVHRSLPFAQRRARNDSNQIGARPNCRPSTTFTRSISMSAASRSAFATNTTPSNQCPGYPRLEEYVRLMPVQVLPLSFSEEANIPETKGGKQLAASYRRPCSLISRVEICRLLAAKSSLEP